MTAPRFAVSLLTLALLSFALLSTPGCAMGTQRFGVVLNARQVSSIQIGKSNKQDILDMFGPPQSFNRVGAWMGFGVSGPDGAGGGRPWGWPADDVFTYEYREENESFITVLLFTWFGRDVLTDRLMVFFDPNDVVKYVAYFQQTNAEYEAGENEPVKSSSGEDEGEARDEAPKKKKKKARKKKPS